MKAVGLTSESSPLVSVAAAGDGEKLKELLKESSGKEVSYYLSESMEGAASEGHLKCVEILLEAACTKFPSIKAFDGGVLPTFALANAVKNGHSEVVERLAPRCHGCNAEGIGFAFFFACYRNDIKCIEILSRSFPDHLNTHGVEGCLAVHVSAQYGDLHTMKVLESAGADFRAKSSNKNGQSPLFFACIGGNVDVVKFILDRTDDVDEPDAFGNTPLLYAIIKNHPDVVRVLLSRGADACGVDAHEQRVDRCLLSAAVGYGNLDVAKILAEVASQKCRTRGMVQATLHKHNGFLEYLLTGNGYADFRSSIHDDIDNCWLLMESNAYSYTEKDVAETLKTLLENGARLEEAASFDANFKLFDISPHFFKLVNFKNLKVFLHYGLAELKWIKEPGSIFSTLRQSFSEYMTRRAPYIRPREDGRRGLLAGETEDILLKLQLYIRYFPQFCLPEMLHPLGPDDLCTYSEKLTCVVGPLKKLCRWNIRSSIVRVHGSVTTNYVTSLGLPNSLKNFILLKNEP